MTNEVSELFTYILDLQDKIVMLENELKILKGEPDGNPHFYPKKLPYLETCHRDE